MSFEVSHKFLPFIATKKEASTGSAQANALAPNP